MPPESINLERLQILLPELQQIWQQKTDAATSYSEAVANIAKQIGMEPAALRCYINAKMRDKLAKLDREHEQLSLLLETFD